MAYIPYKYKSVCEAISPLRVSVTEASCNVSNYPDQPHTIGLPPAGWHYGNVYVNKLNVNKHKCTKEFQF